MKVKTTYRFRAHHDKIWPLLFNSKMDTKKPCYLLMGLPKPIACRLETQEDGRVGGKRQCISDKGTILQNILEWEPGKKLAFEMSETDIYFGPCVESIVESFTLAPVGENTTDVTRETDFQLKRNKLILSIPMWIGLKTIHRYVFRNWIHLSETAS